LAILGDFILTMKAAPPTINISVIGYYKSVEGHPCPMVISAAKSIGYWPINANKHEKGALGEHFNHLLRSQVLRHEVLAPIPSDMVKKFFCRWKT